MHGWTGVSGSRGLFPTTLILLHFTLHRESDVYLYIEIDKIIIIFISYCCTVQTG